MTDHQYQWFVRRCGALIPAKEAGCYSLFCRDSHHWNVLTGEARAACMAKLCAVDLREAVFPVGSIAQTSVARMNAIIVHHPYQGANVYSLLSDSAAGEYFQNAIVDAMGEFNQSE